jgi:hypothetical protein
VTTYWFIWDRIAAVAPAAISWTVVKNGMGIKGYDEGKSAEHWQQSVDALGRQA